MTHGMQRYGVQAALVAVAAVWGATFVMVKDAVAAYPMYSFLTWRFAIAVVAFLVLFPKAARRVDRPTLVIGLLAGALLCVGYIFQTWGLQGTTASKAAFITGMFVVITPLMQSALLRHVPAVTTWAGVVLAVVGLWLLSEGSSGGWSAGDTRVLICAIAYSAHIIVLGSLGKRHEALPLTLVQLATVAVVCGGIAAATEPFGIPDTQSVWIALLVTGVIASTVAFAVQTYAQRHIPPARTALILISEPAFGGLFGWLAGETLGWKGVAGALLILAGMALAEVIGARPDGAEEVVLEPALEGPMAPVIGPDGELSAGEVPVDQGAS